MTSLTPTLSSAGPQAVVSRPVTLKVVVDPVTANAYAWVVQPMLN